MKRIAIVEDYEDMQIIYRRMFRKHKEIEIVLQVATAEEALERIPQIKVDLVIVDISLPGMDGITLTRELCRLNPGLKVLIATGHSKEAYELASKEAGADCFITKDNGPELVRQTCALLGIRCEL